MLRPGSQPAASTDAANTPEPPFDADADADDAVFREYVERRRGQQNFANARSIRNAIERTRLRHAARLVDAGGTVDRQALEVLEPADLLGSAVFDADTGPAPTTEASE